jgi:UDP-N-acetylglucosamine 2-epimerase (non-hydrolysing)
MIKNKKLKILHIVGARPNLMKIAPILRECKKHANIKNILVHTNQQLYKNLKMYFNDFGISAPDYSLDIKFTNSALLIANIIQELEIILNKEKPDLVLILGDVDSSLAAAIAAKKLNFKIAHIESGLRCSDISMPEEINRRLIDQLSDLLFVSEVSGLTNLIKEGFDKSKIFNIGDVMIDNLVQSLSKINQSKILSRLKIEKNKFLIFTIHKSINVDSPQKLKELLNVIKTIIKISGLKIILPIHSRTSHNIVNYNLMSSFKKIVNLEIIPSLNFFDFIKLLEASCFVVTDSAGVQDEAAYLKVPTITYRNSTERIASLNCGSNYLLSEKSNSNLLASVNWAMKLSKNKKKIKNIKLSDGLASQRIVKTILSYYK